MMVKLDKIPSFCLNLDYRVDRWEEVQKEFKEVGLNPLRVSGVVGGTSFNDLSRGQWGCLQSHKKVLEMGLQTGAKEFLVFEDDVVFSPDFNILYTEWSQDIPQNWELVNFGVRLSGPSEQVSTNVLRTYGTCNAHAYLIRKSYAEFLVKGSFYDGYHGPADAAICCGSSRDSSYGFAPMLIWQEQGYSDIEERELPGTSLDQITMLM